MVIVNPQHIEIGDYLTVLNWAQRYDNSYKGDVLQVLSVALPYILVNNLTNGNLKPISLDSRQVSFNALPTDYITKVLGI